MDAKEIIEPLLEELKKLKDKLAREKVSHFMVVAVNGKTGVGKSFLMNLFISYLTFRKQNPQDNQSWIESLSGAKIDGFPLRPDQQNRGTEGIKFWEEFFLIPRPNSNRKMAVILMDCQGNNDLSFADYNLSMDPLILKLAARLSTVFLYNIFLYFEDYDMTVLKRACKDLGEPLKNHPGMGVTGRHIMVVRWGVGQDKPEKESLKACGDEIKRVFVAGNGEVPACSLKAQSDNMLSILLREPAAASTEGKQFIDRVHELCKKLFVDEDYSIAKADLIERIKDAEVTTEWKYYPSSAEKLAMTERIRPNCDRLFSTHVKIIQEYKIEKSSKSQDVEDALQQIIDTALTSWDEELEKETEESWDLANEYLGDKRKIFKLHLEAEKKLKMAELKERQGTVSDKLSDVIDVHKKGIVCAVGAVVVSFAGGFATGRYFKTAKE